MPAFQLPEIARLAHELSLAPARLRLRQLDGAERAVALIDPDREYPLSFVRFHVTGYRPRRAADDPNLAGRRLIEDLVLLIEALSAAAPLPAADVSEPLFAATDLQERFHVSARTITRWKPRGLVARWYLFPDGTRRLAFSDAAIRRFLVRHATLVHRAIGFQVMDEAEKARTIALARELLRDRPRSMNAVARAIAAGTGRATETIRLLLKRFDADHPAAALFAPDVRPPTDDECLVRDADAGASPESLAERYDRPLDQVRTIIRTARARRLADSPIAYVHAPEFDAPDAECVILCRPGDGPVEQVLREKPSGRTPAQLPAYLQALYRTPLLTPAGERDLFRRYNYLKYRAEQLRRGLRPASATDADLERIAAWLDRAAAVKNAIVEANLRLVVSIARRHVAHACGLTLYELISEGNLALLRAVEKFDYSRGFRFSTYATWAITRHFARCGPQQAQRDQRFRTGLGEMLEKAGDPAADEPQTGPPPELRAALAGCLERLDARERAIIERHFGLAPDGPAASLDAIGRDLGISKERARQLKERALRKLRAALGAAAPALA